MAAFVHDIKNSCAIVQEGSCLLACRQTWFTQIDHNSNAAPGPAKEMDTTTWINHVMHKQIVFPKGI